MALPVRHREKFRRDDVERRALRHREAAGIGVVAGGKLDRALDQETADIVADRAERIVIDGQPLAQRLADDRCRPSPAASGVLFAVRTAAARCARGR